MHAENESSQPDESSQSDAELANLVEEMVGTLQSGGSVDFLDYQQRYPHLKPQLEEIAPTLQMLVDVKTSSETRNEANRLVGDPTAIRQPFVESIPERLDDFAIENEIGRGGMGVVYRARQISLGRTVAVKILPWGVIGHERQLARFQVEAQAAAGLQHPGIVPVYSVGCDRGVHYYAMQYIDGESLAAILERTRQERANDGSSQHRVASCSMIAEWGIQVAEALGHAHASGVIHRDIKPGNLLLDSTGKLWITDFGLARISQDSELTQTTDVIGTLRYTSPEQTVAPHTGVDHRSDLYSLGATLYELLTLSRAFEGDDRIAVVDAIRNRDPSAPRKLEPTIPADLETIVLKAMEKDPSSRYETAQALAEDLRRFLSNQPIAAKRPSVPDRLRKWARRHPTVIQSALAVLILAVVGFAATSVLLRREQAETETALAAAEQNFHQSESNRFKAEEAIARSETLLYVRGLGLAARAWRDGDSAGAAALMKSNPAHEQRTDLRDFGWDFLSRSLASSYSPFLRSGDEILTTAYSDGGEFYAAGDARGIIRVWKGDSEQPVQILEAHKRAVHAITFLSNSASLASVGEDGTLRIWRVVDGALVAAKEDAHQGAEIFSVACSSDGRILVSGGGDGVVRVWHPRSLDEMQTFSEHSREVRSVAISPNSRFIVSGGNDRTVQVFDTKTTQQVASLLGHSGMVLCVGFSPSGQQVFSGSNDHTIRIWNWRTEKSDAVIAGHLDGVQTIAMLRDGKRLIAGDRGGQIRVWEVKGRRVIDRYEPEPGDPFYAIRLSPDGRSWVGITSDGRLVERDLGTDRTIELAAGIADQYPHEFKERLAYSADGLRLFCADRILHRDSLEPFSWDKESVLGVSVVAGSCSSFSPDGNILATGWNNTLRLFDSSDGTVIHEMETPARTVGGIRFSPDGRYLAAWFVHEAKVAFWNTTDFSLVGAMAIPGARAMDLEFSSDGMRFATCNQLGEIHVWETVDGNPERVELFEGAAKTVAWAEKDQALAIGVPGQDLLLCWLGDGGDVETIGSNQKIRDVDLNQQRGLALVHDRVAGAVVYDLQRREIAAQSTAGMQAHEDRVWSLALSPDESTLMSGSRDGSLLSWKLRGDEWSWLTRRPHESDSVSDLVWSRDGSKLIAARFHRCVVYDWPSGRQLSQALWSSPIGEDPSGFGFESVTIDPDDQWIASGHDDGTIRIWDAASADLQQTLTEMPIDGGVWCLGVSADGNLLAACSRKENQIRVWDAQSWKEQWALPAADCDDFQFSPDGGELLYCDGRTAVVVDAESGQERLRLPEQSITVNGVAYSSDGRTIATACEDRIVRIWDSASGKLLSVFSGHVGAVTQVVFDPRGNVLVSGDEKGSIRLWHIDASQELYELVDLDSGIEALNFDPSGERLIAVTEDGRVHVFDAAMAE